MVLWKICFEAEQDNKSKMGFCNAYGNLPCVESLVSWEYYFRRVRRGGGGGGGGGSGGRAPPLTPTPDKKGPLSQIRYGKIRTIKEKG